MMTIKEINKQIMEAGLHGSESFVQQYLAVEPYLLENINSFHGLQTEIYLYPNQNQLEQIKYAAIFSDLLSLYMGGNGQGQIQMTFFNEGSKFHKQRMVTAPIHLAPHLNPQNLDVSPAYTHHMPDEIKRTLTDFKPLFETEKSVLRPVRTLMVPAVDKKGEDYLSIFYADPNTCDDHWYIRNSFSHESLPIKNSLAIKDYITPKNSKVLFDLTLPYFRGVTLEKLIHIIMDETDTLSPLRKSLKDLVIKFDEKEKHMQELRQDEIRPQLDLINKRFRNYKNANRWGVASSLAVFVASLIKVEVPIENTAAFISAVVSSVGGFGGVFLSERQFQGKMNELRENPYFLLWRIDRQQKL